jgi:predicted HicB family RNase H-like nuclease
MTFRVRLRRPMAEALAALAVREKTNLAALVAEILQAAVTKGRQPS